MELAAVLPSNSCSSGQSGSTASGGQAADAQRPPSLFPVLLAGRHVKIKAAAHDIRIEGVVVAKEKFVAEHVSGNGGCSEPGGTGGGQRNEDVYIKGALLAKTVTIKSRPADSLAVIFDPNLTDLTDAPGFFAWRVTAWRKQ